MNGCISRVSSIKVSELVLKWGAGIHLLAVQWTPRLRVTSTLTVCGIAMLKQELDSEIWGKGVCDIWEKWVESWGDRVDSAQKNNLNSEVWGKGVCAIWEK